MNLWPHQQFAIEEARQRIAEGHKAIVVSAPTGSGKTRMMTALAELAAGKRKKVVIFTNRKILLDQASEALESQNVSHGIMASGHQLATLRDVQLASIQTIDSRVFKNETWELPQADVAMLDEAHSQTSAVPLKVIEHYKAAGSVVLGFTATPVGLGGIYSTLIQAGTYSELKAAGVLLGGDIYAPSEPDMQGVKMNRQGEYHAKAMSKRVQQCTVFGDVWDHWWRLNPHCRPTVLFAPGVAFSRDYVRMFNERGVSSAHIDGDTEPAEREDIFGRLADGSLSLVSSCGVLREGWNFPGVCHGILLQVCGALSTYIQIAGRLMRSAPGKEKWILQDHAGAFWRHGAPDMDRDWSLEDTDKSIAKEQKKAVEAGKQREPICCPACHYVRMSGPHCPACGHQHEKSVRQVRTVDGKLVKMTGQVVKVKKPVSGAERAWSQALFQAGASGKTMAQASHLFHSATGEWPSSSLKYVPPKGSNDWNRKVRDVYPWTVKRKSNA